MKYILSILLLFYGTQSIGQTKKIKITVNNDTPYYRETVDTLYGTIEYPLNPTGKIRGPGMLITYKSKKYICKHIEVQTNYVEFTWAYMKVQGKWFDVIIPYIFTPD